MFHAVSKKSVSFNQLDERTLSRIRLKKVSADTGEDVPDENIVGKAFFIWMNFGDVKRIGSFR